jgi:hypothetical protein
LIEALIHLRARAAVVAHVAFDVGTPFSRRDAHRRDRRTREQRRDADEDEEAALHAG